MKLPFLCMYYVTDWCNARCSFCNIWENPAYKPSPLSRVERDLRDLKRLGVSYFDFTGGEPFMRPELPQIFALAEKYGLRYGFTSNASLFQRRWNEIKDLRIFGPSFSLDGPPEYHDHHRGLKDNFQQVIQAVELCKSVDWNPIIIFTVTEHTFDYIDYMAGLARDLDVLMLMTPVFSYRGVGEDSLSHAQLRRMKKLMRNRNISVDPRYIDFLIRGGNDVEARTCRSMDTHVVVAPDSSLFVPCYHYATFRMPTPDGIYAAVRSDRWRELASLAGRYDFCKGCNIYCYMDLGLTLRHPAQSVRPVLLHLVKWRRRGGHEALRKLRDLWP